MSDDTCYTENYRPSCELVGTGGALSELGYMRTDSNEIVEIEPNVQQYECDKFWTTLEDSTPNSSSSFLSYKYLNDPRAGSGSYYNNDGDESNRKLAVKCMPRGGGGEDSGCMSPLKYFDEIPNLPEDPQQKMETWEQLFTSMREQFLDPNICQRTESIYPTEPQAVVGESEPPAVVGEPEPAVEESEPNAAAADTATESPAAGGGADTEPNAAAADTATDPPPTPAIVTTDTEEVDPNDITTCQIDHILGKAVTNVNDRISDTSKHINHNCPSEDVLNSGGSCYLYCNSLNNGEPPTQEQKTNYSVGTETNPSKLSRISCGTVSMGQELNCAPSDSRIEGDMCPHSHHIYLKCSEDSEEIDIDFEIDAKTATAGGLAGFALGAAGYLIFF
jgi:hypothetical protein